MLKYLLLTRLCQILLNKEKYQSKKRKELNSQIIDASCRSDQKSFSNNNENKENGQRDKELEDNKAYGINYQKHRDSQKKTHLSTSASSITGHTSSSNIGHYVLGKSIGKGTFGKVKEGTHILTGQKVAIKILEKEKIADVADVERVAREIHILKIIRHPHLIQLFEIIETPKQLFLIMEYTERGELFNYIVSKSKLREKEACKFFQQIISGVEYIHKLRICHRDLKPENLLLDHNNDIKLIDFGLSNTYKKGNTLKTACGSPCYAAPEVVAGKRYHGLMVDIWSCGVILFAMVCGYLPFEDPDTGKLYKKILGARYQIPNHVSPECKDLMKKILDTNPNTRITIEEMRNHPWYQLTVPHEKEGIIVGVNSIPVNNEVLDLLESYGFNFDMDDSKVISGKGGTGKVPCRLYTKKCIELNKHNHFTTSYYLLLDKWEKTNGKLRIEISESVDRFSRKPNIPLDYKSSVRGNSVQMKDNNQIDPFAHFTPVARRFIEGSNIVKKAKAYSQNPSSRVHSTRINGYQQQLPKNKRIKKPTPNNLFPSEKSYSPRNSAGKPVVNNFTNFTSTMVGSFRDNSGYSDGKESSGYETAHGPFFNARSYGSTNKANRKPYHLKIKPQLPNVSKHRVVLRSTNNERCQNKAPAYPNSVINPKSVNRTGSNSPKKAARVQNNSFQIVNNFMQTNFNGFRGAGSSMNQTQINARKTTYGSLAYPSKNIPKPLNVVPYDKNPKLYHIYKSKASSSERRRVSGSGKKEQKPLGYLFGRQFGNPISKRTSSDQNRINQ
ncbi:unnamed protein product [Moneuplotes crassus]|uniref:non-specific serine/threonine protein kinase n=2 Tax=Euplotes crassus TaxID=5936 RepID=A0AAD1XNU7_EUPCR|nr:unnamed protein product [Moneuplotes crassus]